jgi:hypothetical protein
VELLWEAAKGLPVEDANPEDFPEWLWYSWEPNITLKGVAEHMERVLQADLSYPVLVSAEGFLMDGCHRLVHAYLKKVPVKVVRFLETPAPHRRTPEAPDVVDQV